MHGPRVASVRQFSHQHARMRVVVEDAFGRIKSRWHVLRMTCAHPHLAASVREVCVLLDNFVEERNGAYDGEGREANEEDQYLSAAADTEDSASAAGAQRQIELFKALGLPWVDSAKYPMAPVEGGSAWERPYCV